MVKNKRKLVNGNGRVCNYQMKFLIKYLIGQNFGGQNFLHKLEISAVFPPKIFLLFYVLKWVWYYFDMLLWTILEYQPTNFRQTKFSADKIFGSKHDFQHFCPPKFCPIRYHEKISSLWSDYEATRSSCQ